MKVKHKKKKKVETQASQLGEFFHAKRCAIGISEQAVADYLGDVSVGTLRDYESGKRLIPLNHIYALTNCLNLSPGHVMRLIHKVYGPDKGED